MNKAIKAALLSALVYPGLGHYFLKKYIISMTLISAFTLPLYLLINNLISKAQYIVEQINNGQIALNINAITAALTEQTIIQPQGSNIKIYILVLVWIFSICDSYRVGQTILTYDEVAKNNKN